MVPPFSSVFGLRASYSSVRLALSRHLSKTPVCLIVLYGSVNYPIFFIEIHIFNGLKVWSLLNSKIHVFVNYNTSQLSRQFSFSPESVRWLLVKGKVQQAEAALRKVAKCNQKPIPEEPLKGCERQRLGDLRDLFKSRSITHKTLVSWYCW